MGWLALRAPQFSPLTWAPSLLPTCTLACPLCHMCPAPGHATGRLRLDHGPAERPDARCPAPMPRAHPRGANHALCLHAHVRKAGATAPQRPRVRSSGSQPSSQRAHRRRVHGHHGCHRRGGHTMRAGLRWEHTGARAGPDWRGGYQRRRDVPPSRRGFHILGDHHTA